jgi:hypothetical protein
MNFKNLVVIISLISSVNVCAQEKSGDLSISLNLGIGNTNVRTFANLYPILTPRISYQKNRFAYGVEANRFCVNSGFKARDLGVFTRYYTNLKYLHLVEVKVNRGVVKGSELNSNYNSFAVTPGWEWKLDFIKNLSCQALVDFYYRDRQLQRQNGNVTLRFGVNYKL